MTMYFFDLRENGTLFRDDEGTELPDIGTARIEATRTMTDFARDRIPGDSPRHNIRMTVRDAGDRVVMTLELAFQTDMHA
jgi:hypothetical protein